MDDFDLFMENICRYTNIDLRKYKRPQMQRRLTALRDKRGFRDFMSYFEALKKDDALFGEFLDRMTINVSEFFRNPNRWDVVRDRLVPELIGNKRRLKVWSAACSTGEEPYTLVMLLSQFMPLSDIQILATDLDENALQKAKQGLYSERSLHFVPPELKRKYFTETGNHLFAVSDAVKRCVTFKRHNLLEDRFENDFDLIVCRNVIIYFTEEAKDVLYRKFSDALRPGGVLFVGSTEQIFNPQSFQFTTYDTFFYQRQ
ncbi:chemotaxis protein CheR [Tumebacillus algifaecis]|uniref:protein-glutamate O-methyltransferase n=1 Tax=Tumebacillus algifaecis TaxID=1214604 RepID=A0A223D6Q9_9BACL|nr:protein-glutamate O-methyltransferase CheR [Tumebacillus algifaecis]ASS77180.1 chemotaxis protein CheR [Tumebacillus algifaecis]